MAEYSTSPHAEPQSADESAEAPVWLFVRFLCACPGTTFVSYQNAHQAVLNFTLTGTKTCWSIRALPAAEAFSTDEIQEYKQDGVVLEKLKKMHWILWMNYSEASSPLGILTSYYLLQLQPVTLLMCTEFKLLIS